MPQYKARHRALERIVRTQGVDFRTKRGRRLKGMIERLDAATVPALREASIQRYAEQAVVLSYAREQFLQTKDDGMMRWVVAMENAHTRLGEFLLAIEHRPPKTVTVDDWAEEIGAEHPGEAPAA
jgi:hypothetical protein